MYNVVIGN